MDKDTDSTVTSVDETENFCDNPTKDILAEGIISLFRPTVDSLHEKVRATRSAQTKLYDQLVALELKLKSVEDVQKMIPDFNEKVKKLITIKHKVTVVANILQNSQKRLNELHYAIEKEQQHKQILLKGMNPSH